MYFSVADKFWSYTSGVYDPSGCSNDVNHGMVVVGYKWTGVTSTSYWIVRNSWSVTWGDQAGHVRIRMTGDGSGPWFMQTYVGHMHLHYLSVVVLLPSCVVEHRYL